MVEFIHRENTKKMVKKPWATNYLVQTYITKVFNNFIVQKGRTRTNLMPKNVQNM